MKQLIVYFAINVLYRVVQAQPKLAMGDWSSWSAYGSCSVTCGSGGWRVRTRVCNPRPDNFKPPPAPNPGGLYCPGSPTDITSCTEAIVCPSCWRHETPYCVIGNDIIKYENAPVDQSKMLCSFRSCWRHETPSCVIGNNIIKYENASVDQCKMLCSFRTDCKAFEYGVSHGGKSTVYKPRDCQLQSSSNNKGCNARYWNLDLYVKIPC